MSGLTDLAGAINGSVTTISVDTALTLAVGDLLLIDDELFLASGALVAQTSLTGMVRGSGGTVAVSHDDEAIVYQVLRVFHPGAQIEVVYVNSGVVEIHTIQVAQNGLVNPTAAPAELTDSTGGAADTTLDANPANLTDSSSGAADETLDANTTNLTDSTGGSPVTTLVVVRSDTAAHTAADAIANFATLNAQVNARDVVLRDNIASVNAKVNARDVVLRDNIASINAQLNLLQTALISAGVLTS